MTGDKLKFLLILSTLEGAVALLSLFIFQPFLSSPTLNGILLLKFTLIVFACALCLITAYVTWESFADPPWWQIRLGRLAVWLSIGNHLLTSLTILFLALITGIAALVVVSLPAAHRLGIIRDLILGTFPLFIWGLLVLAQALVWLGFYYFSSFSREKKFIQPAVLSKIFLVYFLVVFSLAHWMILIFQLPVFDIIPGWFWKFQVKPFTPRDWLFVLMLAAVLSSTCLLIRQPEKRWRNLFLLAALGYGLQFGFGFMDGKGYESIRLKFAASYHKSYAEHAADRPGLIQAIKNYEEKYSREIYLGTKPPGVLVTYVVTQKISAMVFSPKNHGERVTALTRFMAYLFPMIACLVLPLLYLFSRNYLDARQAYLPSILYLTCSNVLLIPLFLDQALYPALFLVCTIVLFKGLRNQSFIIFFLAGLLIYGCLFFNFAFLPLLGLALSWLILHATANRQEWRLASVFKLLAGLGIGLGFGYLLFYFTFNYDFFTRYQHAFASHRAIKLGGANLPALTSLLLLNNVDIAAWSGFPIFILSLAQIVSSVIAIFRRQADKVDIFVIAVAFMYGGLNLFSQTLGEVGRIWLFMVPLFSLLAAVRLLKLSPFRWKAVAIVVVFQLVTVFLTFHFQDFFA